MRPLHALAALAGLLFATGCCGGYSVVRTTVLDHAVMREDAKIEAADTSSVLHFSRLGEAPNACKSGAQYTDDLWIQVPSLQPGQAFTLGTNGVVVRYERQQDGAKIAPSRLAGTVTIREREAESLSVGLAITITLPSGEVITLDSDYDFHPMRDGRGGGPRLVAGAACSRVR